MTTETTANPVNAFSPSVFLRRQGRSASFHLTLSMLAAIGGGVLMILSAWFLAGMIDAVAFHQASLPEITGRLYALAGLYLARAGLVGLAEHQGGLGAIAIKTDLRRKLTDALRGQTRFTPGAQHTGGVLGTVIEGVEALHPYYARYIPARVLTVFVPLAILVVTFPVDWISGVVLTVTAPLIVVFMILIGQNTQDLNRRQWSRLTRLNSHFLTAIKGLPTLRMLGAAAREAKFLAKSSDRLRRETMAVLRVTFLSSLALELFATLGIAIVAVLLGFRLLWGEVTFHRAFLVLLLAPEFYLPLRRMGAHYHARMDAVAAAGKIHELLTHAPVLKTQSRGFNPASPHGASIRFENVTYLYPGRNEGVRDITLEIPAGQKWAFIGPSGAGKTTLLGLLLGFLQPQSGRILVDGQELGMIDPRIWWRHVSYMPQRPHMPCGSVEDAIRLGNPQVDAQAVGAIMQDLAIADLQKRVVDEDGRGLSGGQIHRVALARALLGKPACLVLDEPTTHLDAISAAIINEKITALAGATIVMAAHHPETIRRADHVVLLADGRILTQGTPDTVLQKGMA